MYVGLDLAGSPKNPTGWFILPSMNHGIVHTDDEIIEICKGAEVVAIDGPLSFPDEWYRDCDIELMKMGFNVLSPKLKGMIPLARRAMNLKSMLNERGITVVETLASASRKILGIERDEHGMTRDEADAFACSIVAMLYSSGKATAVGSDCRIFLP